MRLYFDLKIQGNETLEKKFFAMANNNPNLNMDLVRAFANIIVLAFGVQPSDEMVIESFKAGKLAEIDAKPPQNKV